MWTQLLETTESTLLSYAGIGAPEVQAKITTAPEYWHVDTLDPKPLPHTHPNLRRQRQKGTESLLKEIITQNFLSMEKEIDIKFKKPKEPK